MRYHNHNHEESQSQSQSRGIISQSQYKESQSQSRGIISQSQYKESQSRGSTSQSQYKESRSQSQYKESQSQPVRYHNHPTFAVVVLMPLVQTDLTSMWASLDLRVFVLLYAKVKRSFGCSGDNKIWRQ